MSNNPCTTEKVAEIFEIFNKKFEYPETYKGNYFKDQLLVGFEIAYLLGCADTLITFQNDRKQMLKLLKDRMLHVEEYRNTGEYND